MTWVVLLGCLAVVVALCIAINRQRRRARLRQSVLQTDREVTSEYYRARRAMNHAAGQGWRNLADGDPSQ